MRNKEQSNAKDWGKVKSQAEEMERQADIDDMVEQDLKQNIKGSIEHPEYKELENKLTLAEQKANDYWNKLLLLKADMENLERRSERAIEKAHKFALEKFATELLVIVDNLERSLEVQVEENEIFKNLLTGVEMTLKMFLDTLRKFGVVQINPFGETFDPNFHEAISMQHDANAKPNTVLQVIQKGYLLNERLLRPAMVVVNAG